MHAIADHANVPFPLLVADTSSSTSTQVHLDRLRVELGHAFCRIALEVQAIVFRCLSDIAVAVPITDTVVEALYHARKACLAYLSDLERGCSSTQKRQAALTSIDLLEAAFLTKRQRVSPLDPAIRNR